MNLHEFQAKGILRKFGVETPVGMVISNPDAAIEAAETIQSETGTTKWAVKAQIHAGGRDGSAAHGVAAGVENSGQRAVDPSSGAPKPHQGAKRIDRSDGPVAARVCGSGGDRR